jgi:hypothetical protein
MRTTLTLDDDVSAMLERVRAERRAGLKEVVNEALRQGLQQMSTVPRRRPRYRTPSVSLGRCLVGNLDNISDTLAIAEGEAFR